MARTAPPACRAASQATGRRVPRIPSATAIKWTQAQVRDARTPRMVTLSPTIPKSAAAAAREFSMNKITVALLLLLLLAASSFARKEKSAKDENLLLQLEANFAADVAKHGHDAFLTYISLKMASKLLTAAASTTKRRCAS